MALLEAKTFIAAALEASYGTDVIASNSVTIANNAIPCQTDVTISPLEGSEIERNLTKNFAGANKTIRVEDYVKVDMTTELAGSGTAGVAARWEKLLLSCNFKRINVSAVASEVIGAAIVPSNTATLSASAVAVVGGTITIGDETGSETRTVLVWNNVTKLVTVDKPFAQNHLNGANAITTGAGAVSGTIASVIVPSNTITLGATANASVVDYYAGTTVTVDTLTNVEVREIIAYDATTKIATVSIPFALPHSAVNYSIGAAISYTPVTSIDFDSLLSGTGSKSLSIYFFKDTVLHSLTGARGTVSFDLSSKKEPTAKWSFMGLFGVVKDFTAPDANSELSNWKDPLVVGTENTSSVLIHDFRDGVFEKLTIDVANETKYRKLINFEGVLSVNRKPKASISFESTTVAVKNWIYAAKASDCGIFSFRHGKAVGNSIAFTMPVAQISKPAYSNSDGISMTSIDLSLVPKIGNDELRITVK